MLLLATWAGLAAVKAQPLRAVTVRDAETVTPFATAVTVPLATAMPLHVVDVVPETGPTVFVPSVNVQFVNVRPDGEPVQVTVCPLVTWLVQEIEGVAGVIPTGADPACPLLSLGSFEVKQEPVQPV
jgi:hypothetical protein